MLQAFATKMPRGISWRGLAIVAVALMVASTALAQTPPQPPSGGEKKSSADPKAAGAPDKDGDADAPPTEQVFLDPNARKSLTVFNPLVFNGPPIRVAASGDDRVKVQNMASKAANTDPEFLKRYVEFFAVELTKRDNLNAILNPPPSQKPTDSQARALERAMDALNKPMIDAKANGNQEFLDAYTRILFESSLPKLLDPSHNYLSRIDSMIVLGMAGASTPAGLDLYIAQLKRPEQIIWVKLWAARGLTLAAREGEVDLDASKANPAAEALVGFLDSDPKLPWPAQMRALAALGSLRVASVNTPKGKLDVAAVVMKFLTNREAVPEVRAEAAWALGLLRIPGSSTPYNFSLIGHEVGELTADLGSRIVQEYDANPADFDKSKDLATHLTSLLLFHVYPSVIGEDGVRDSGLLRSTHPSAGPGGARPFLTKLDDRVKAVTRDAYELLRSGGAGNKAARNSLDSKVADLKTFLASSPPKDRRLLPGGPEFRGNASPQVAGASRP